MSKSFSVNRRILFRNHRVKLPPLLELFVLFYFGKEGSTRRGTVAIKSCLNEPVPSLTFPPIIRTKSVETWTRRADIETWRWRHRTARRISTVHAYTRRTQRTKVAITRPLKLFRARLEREERWHDDIGRVNLCEKVRRLASPNQIFYLALRPPNVPSWSVSRERQRCTAIVGRRLNTFFAQCGRRCVNALWRAIQLLCPL